jgi:hypothetical protein
MRFGECVLGLRIRSLESINLGWVPLERIFVAEQAARTVYVLSPALKHTALESPGSQH